MKCWAHAHTWNTGRQEPQEPQEKVRNKRARVHAWQHTQDVYVKPDDKVAMRLKDLALIVWCPPLQPAGGRQAGSWDQCDHSAKVPSQA